LSKRHRQFSEFMQINQHDNELISSMTHFIGFLFSIAGLVILVVFAALYGKAEHIIGFSIFGSGLILLYFASAMYHFISKNHQAKRKFQSIDHAMIYILIASTYTPLVLAMPQKGWGWSLFGVIWGLACIGITLKIILKNTKKWLALALYVVMGWLILIALPALNASVPTGGLWWLISGGVLYTVGIIFFVLEKAFPRKGWFGMHEMFHLFVMSGSFFHFWFMLEYVLYV